MKLILSPEAIRDLVAIDEFTADRWDDAQADAYLRQLHQACQDLTENPHRGRRRADIPPPYLALGVGSHLIIYRVNSIADSIEVLNILHPAMDIAARLKAALLRRR